MDASGSRRGPLLPQGPELVGPRAVTIAILVAALLWALAAPAAIAADPSPPVDGDSPKTVLKPQVAEGLRGGLAEVAVRARQGDDDPLPGMIDRQRLGRREIASRVAVDPGKAGAVRAAIGAARGAVMYASDDAIEAYLPTNALERIAAVDGVDHISPILERMSQGWVSPAIRVHGASAWHEAGWDGSGIKLGLIDLGFEGITQLIGTEIPTDLVARCYPEFSGTHTDDLRDCENGIEHGTALAELAVDMAPGAQLYIANPLSTAEYHATIRWMTSHGVRVISASTTSGYIFDGPGDGSSGRRGSTYEDVELAVSLGALWVNAAGNYGESGWTGDWIDADEDAVLEFAPGDETNSLTLREGDWIRVAMRWPDPWGESANDYDIFVSMKGVYLAGGADWQMGDGDPVEVFDFVAPADGRYDLTVEAYDAEPVQDLQILIYSGPGLDLEHIVANGTLPSPADSSDPGMLTVGAVQMDDPGQIETYSSRGPTADGRIKPDLVGVDCMSTLTIGWFCGTSAPTPLTAGAAALVLQAYPELDAVELAEFLRDRAVPLGVDGPDNVYGHGRLALREPATERPAAATIALTVSSKSVSWPDPVTLRAALDPPPVGTPRVQFQWSIDGREWTLAGSAATDASGVAELTLKPTATRRYRAVALATGVTSATVSLVVRQRLTVRASTSPAPGASVTTVEAGTIITFDTTVRPITTSRSEPTVDFTVYRRDRGTWVEYRTIRVDAVGGRVGIPWAFQEPGQWYVRARAPATVWNAASAWSATLRYDVVALPEPGTLRRLWAAKTDELRVALSTYAPGSGVLEITASGLPASRLLAPVLHGGSCSAVGERVATLPSIRSDASGRLEGRLVVGKSQASAVARAAVGTGHLVLLLRTGSSRQCADLRSHPVTVAIVPATMEATAMAFDDEAVWLAEGATGLAMVSRIDPATDIIDRRFRSLAPRAYGLASVGDSLWVNTTWGLVRLDRSTGEGSWTDLYGGGPLASCGSALWAASGDPFEDVNSVVHIDAQTGEVAGAIDLERPPIGIACTATAVWVATDRGSVVRIDPDTHEIVATIAVAGVYRVAVSEGAVWASVRAARSASGAVVRIDPTTNSVTARVSVGHDPAELTVVADTVYVAMAGEPTLVLVRGEAVVDRVEVAAKSTGILATPGALWLLHPRLAGHAGSAVEAGGLSHLNI